MNGSRPPSTYERDIITHGLDLDIGENFLNRLLNNHIRQSGQSLLNGQS